MISPFIMIHMLHKKKNIYYIMFFLINKYIFFKIYNIVKKELLSNEYFFIYNIFILYIIYLYIYYLNIYILIII